MTDQRTRSIGLVIDSAVPANSNRAPIEPRAQLKLAIVYRSRNSNGATDTRDDAPPAGDSVQ